MGRLFVCGLSKFSQTLLANTLGIISGYTALFSLHLSLIGKADIKDVSVSKYLCLFMEFKEYLSEYSEFVFCLNATRKNLGTNDENYCIEKNFSFIILSSLLYLSLQSYPFSTKIW